MEKIALDFCLELRSNRKEERVVRGAHICKHVTLVGIDHIKCAYNLHVFHIHTLMHIICAYNLHVPKLTIYLT